MQEQQRERDAWQVRASPSSIFRSLALPCTNVSALSSRCQMTSMCRARRLHLFAVFQRGLASTRIADIAVGDRLAISLDMLTQISWL